MKKKILASAAALAMAVITVFSTAGTVQAEEGNVTDKPWVEVVVDETETCAFSDEDWDVIVKDFGWDTGSNFISILPSETSISINWDNSSKTIDDVNSVYIMGISHMRNANGGLERDEFAIYRIPYSENEDGIDKQQVLSNPFKVSCDDLNPARYQNCFYSLRVIYNDNSYSDALFAFEGTAELYNLKKIEEELPSNSEDYTLDMSNSTTPISAKDFETLLSENATKDVVIKSNNNVTFTFAKGTMQAVEGKESYDFSTTVNSAYTSDMPYYITQNNFVSQINFNYSGKLPAEASIRFPVGTQYAGKTLYYSLMNEDNTFAEVQAVVVDSEGFITVKQNHCSSYVVTTEEPKVQEKPTDTNTENTNTENTNTGNNTNTAKGTETNGVTSPKTGESMPVMPCILLCVSAVGLIIAMRKKKVTM